LRDYKGEDGEYGCGKERVELNLTNFHHEHLHKFRVFDPFWSMIHISQALRRQSHSGFFLVLKKADCNHHERDKQKQAPPAAYAGNDHDDQHKNRQDKYCHTECQAFTALFGTDVLNYVV
jgi:hypothetical protein